MYVLCIHPARDQSDQCNAIINELQHVRTIVVRVLEYILPYVGVRSVDVQLYVHVLAT